MLLDFRLKIILIKTNCKFWIRRSKKRAADGTEK